VKHTVFWKVTLCNLVEAYRRFAGNYCPHLQGFIIKPVSNEPSALHILNKECEVNINNNSSVDIAAAGTAGIRFPTGVRDFCFFLYCFQTETRALPASYLMCTRGSFLGDRAVSA
jgi:hypothetical protein